MAKIKFDTRLEPDVVARIKTVADADNLSVDDLLNAALDDYETRKNDPRLLSERVASLENELIGMVDILRSILPQVVVANDRSRRSYNIEQIVLGWCEHLISVGNDGEARTKLWLKEKEKIMQSIAEKESEATNAK